MTKDMKEHRQYIESRMETADQAVLAKLSDYHNTRMKDFQHERLIHLIVTSLLALVTIMMIVASVITKEVMFYIVDLMLLPLLGAYIIHYRSLENGVQSLYSLTKRLGEKCIGG